MSILDLAVPVEENVESVSLLLYGDSGSGKTTFLGSGRDNGKHDLIIGVEKGTVSAARAGSKVNVLPVKDLEHLFQIVEAIEDEPHRFEWVCIDGITKLQDVIWTAIITDAVSKRPNRSRFTREIQEYGEAQAILKEIVQRLVDSDANVIFTATTDLFQDENAETVARPNIHGKDGGIARWVTEQVDVVCYLTVGEMKGKTYRKFSFNKSDHFWSKDRFQVFEKPVANLTLEKYTQKLLDKGASDGAEV